jgi:hypothetical protein
LQLKSHCPLAVHVEVPFTGARHGVQLTDPKHPLAGVLPLHTPLHRCSIGPQFIPPLLELVALLDDDPLDELDPELPLPLALLELVELVELEVEPPDDPLDGPLPDPVPPALLPPGPAPPLFRLSEPWAQPTASTPERTNAASVEPSLITSRPPGRIVAHFRV